MALNTLSLLIRPSVRSYCYTYFEKHCCLNSTSMAPTRSVEWRPIRSDRGLVQINSTPLNRDQYSFWRLQYSIIYSETRFASQIFELTEEKHAVTLGAVPSQWVFYLANFLNLLQLATCSGSYHVDICIIHTHTPTSPNITFRFPVGTVPSHLLSQTHRRRLTRHGHGLKHKHLPLWYYVAQCLLSWFHHDEPCSDS